MYTIIGVVVYGKQLGRTLGFPTANIKPATEFSGDRGVYAGYIGIEGYEAAYRTMVNIGSHPTFPEGAPTIEAHIFDFSGDIYGKKVTLTLTRFLRPEQKFQSREAFLAQLRADEKEARNG